MRVLTAAPPPFPGARMVREMTHGTVIEIGDFRLVILHYSAFPIPWPPDG